MKTTFIYVLIDPRDNLERYIGYAKNPKIRLSGHISNAKIVYTPFGVMPITQKDLWLIELKESGYKPIIKTIAEVPAESRNYWESFFYEIYQGCPLLNTKPVLKNFNDNKPY